MLCVVDLCDVIMCGYCFLIFPLVVCVFGLLGVFKQREGTITMGILLLLVDLDGLSYSPFRGWVIVLVFVPGRLLGGGFAHGVVGGAGTA